MKRILDDDSISPEKHFHGDKTCLLDLPNEIFLMICYHLSIYDIFHFFYTPDIPAYHLHRLISDYYTKMSIGGIKFDEFDYLIKLFNKYIRPSSLKLSNSKVSRSIKYCFKLIEKNELKLIFNNLIELSLLDCFPKDLSLIEQCYSQYLTKFQYLHLTICDDNIDNQYFRIEEKFDVCINRILFNN